MRLPRKVKKLFKNKLHDEWMLFLDKKKAQKDIQNSLDIIFAKNYKDVKRVFHEAIKHFK